MPTSSSLHILLVTIGSAGDVHPFVGLGQALRRRGHRVSILTGAYFQPLIERAGLEFVELFSAAKYREMIDNPDLWHPVRERLVRHEARHRGARSHRV
ncbi:MAG: glycosyltransferase [Pirellulales bacterium]